MSNEITFNTQLSEPPRTQADFTYKISPTVISITDTGLGSCPVTEDIEAVLRKIEHWRKCCNFVVEPKPSVDAWKFSSPRTNQE